VPFIGRVTYASANLSSYSTLIGIDVKTDRVVANLVSRSTIRALTGKVQGFPNPPILQSSFTLTVTGSIVNLNLYWTVPAESLVYTVPKEIVTWTVPAESLTYIVQPEVRTWTIQPEVRTYQIIKEI